MKEKKVNGKKIKVYESVELLENEVDEEELEKKMAGEEEFEDKLQTVKDRALEIWDEEEPDKLDKYWELGKIISIFEENTVKENKEEEFGRGDALIERLHKKTGKDTRKFRGMRDFYRLFPEGKYKKEDISWSEYRELIDKMNNHREVVNLTYKKMKKGELSGTKKVREHLKKEINKDNGS